MNANRRKQIGEALEALSAIKAQIESIRDDESDAYESMPESLKYSERGEKCESAVSALEEAVSYCDSVESSLNEAQE